MSRVEGAIKAISNDICKKDVLEVACGCAEFSICASKIARVVQCIDLDSARLRQEIFEHYNIIFNVMDATAMHYADKTFDTIVMYNAIGHLSQIMASVIGECQRVLKTDGAIIIVSSFKLDKNIIHNDLLPLLDSESINYVFRTDKYFDYVRL